MKSWRRSGGGRQGEVWVTVTRQEGFKGLGFSGLYRLWGIQGSGLRLGVSRAQALGSKAILFFGGPFLSLQYKGPLNGKFRRCGYGLNPKVSSRPKDPQSGSCTD